MMTPMKKKTFKVPSEANLVKMSDDFMLVKGRSQASGISGAVFPVMIALATTVPSGSSCDELRSSNSESG